ncbi:MAG TPA: murein biosynthesis integral membrane protein MurJ [Gemmatimonadaceae bacterium]|nr:murein biosynthesis integral membrane protein MurJ [Gemmatimonadaceae bacterium]
MREPRPHGAADHRAPRTHTGAAAALVATGILASRVLGLIRNSLIARYLGTTVAADAWTAAFKVPNTLQNLFGEGALSAAFVPVYARLLGAGEDAEADRVAGAVAAILGLTIAVFVLVGILAAPQLIYAIAPGFSGARRALTVTLTRILFPGAGFLALSAWCLGVLNSHRKFLIAYTAPIAWNLSLIVALLWWGPGADKAHVVTVMAWASVCGSMLQFAVQLPAVRKVAPRLRVAFEATSTNVREIIRNFGPAFVSRGVVQISSFIDQILTSFLPIGMPAVFGFANTLYLLPVSMFGAAISVAELPEMSRATAEEHEAGGTLRPRIDAGLRRIAFLVVPSAVAFVTLGDVLIRVVYEHGHFTAIDAVYTWAVLCGSAVGLLAGTLGRLYSSTYYALRDTRTPLRFAVIRVALTMVLGATFAFGVPRWFGLDPHWGAAGLSASAGLAAWVEFTLLRRRLNARIGETGLPARFTITLWGLAAASAVLALLVQRSTGDWRRMAAGVAVIAVYGTAYMGGAMLLRVPEAHGIVSGFTRRFRPGR